MNVTTNGDAVILTAAAPVQSLTPEEAHGLALRLTTAATEAAAAPRPLRRSALVDARIAEGRDE